MSKKPVAIDLFCGKGGWTNALIDEGFEVYGFDNAPQPDYKGNFVLCDILELTVDAIRPYGAVFGVCSSPCEQFSIHGMKHFHPNPKHPVMGIRLFEHARYLLQSLGIPHVMENVRSAEKFLGKAVNHCGPFYMWGDAVPAIFPPESYQVTKGIDVGSSKIVKAMNKEERRAYRKQFIWNQAWSSSKQRCRDTAQASMIPLPIARAVAQAAAVLTRGRNE